MKQRTNNDPRRAALAALLTVGIPGGISGMALGLLATPAVAQGFSDGYKFLKAVKDSNGQEVTEMLDTPGSGTIVVNAKESGTGRTALHLVIARRDATWVNFLLSKGANPEIGDREGERPLHLATQLGFIDGIKILLARGAKVDGPNNSRETPLIRAVQLRDVEAVRTLLAGGANPDLADSVAGLSARQYAQRDSRGSDIAAMIANVTRNAPVAPAVVGPNGKGLDFSGGLFKP